MSDDDLIRRGDVLALFPDINDLRHMNVGVAAVYLSERRNAIRALPATAAREAALREAAAMCDGEERSGGTGWECRDAILALISANSRTP